MSAVLLGAATGDAFGVPLEFLSAAAAAAYGADAIPQEWLAKLGRREYLDDLARRFSVIVNQVRS